MTRGTDTGAEVERSTATRPALIPVPARRFLAHELADGAVVFAFDLDGPGRLASRFGCDALTPAERRVVELAIQGLNDHEIATCLSRSRHTVSNLLRRAYKRLGVSSRWELAALVREGLSTRGR